MRKETIEKYKNFEVIKLYTSGKTTLEISKIVGCSPSSINTYLKENNIPLRKASKRESIRELPIIGTKFGQWTIISDKIKQGSEITGNEEYRNLYWEVKCKCGAIAWRLPNALKQGTSTACKSCCMLSGDIHSFINSKFNNIIRGLETRKKVGQLEFNITSNYLQELYNKNQKCQLSGIDLTFDSDLKIRDNNLSVDRIDSSIGYIEGNVQLVHKDINMMKGTLSQERFIELCKLVTNKNNKNEI